MLGFPLPYRDELLYSTIARHGIHSGTVSPKELLSEVFGDRKILATSDLPSHLKRIAALYPEEVGITPESLLYRNTLFPLYAPFVGEARRFALIRELTANGKSFVHLTAGAAASRIKQPGARQPGRFENTPSRCAQAPVSSCGLGRVPFGRTAA
ncbi:TPA: TniQ family protein [Vibrio fluvialis]|nr:TniQ family protein [Vibrio fluvialis]